MPASAARVAARYARIQLKPRDIGRYLDMLARKAAEAAREITAKSKAVLAVEEAHEWLHGASHWELGFTEFDRMLDRTKTITDFASSMRDKARDFERADSISNRRDLVYYAHRDVERVVEDLQRVRATEADIRKYKADLAGLLNDYFIHQRVLDDVLAVADAVRGLLVLLDDAVGKLGELVRRGKEWASSLDGEAAPPPSDDVEVIYHASINARRLLSSGFSLHGPPAVEGVGGSQTDISFTFDLYIAKEIMRCLREAILIANGEVTARDITEWARADGTLAKVQSSYRGIVGDKPPNTPSLVMTLWQSYLTYSRRYDPVFFGTGDALVNRFRGKHSRDVGVLVCHVNVKHPDVEYLPAEEEFRVPPDAVVSVDKIIN